MVDIPVSTGPPCCCDNDVEAIPVVIPTLVAGGTACEKNPLSADPGFSTAETKCILL